VVDLDLSEFYAVYAINYCQGKYLPAYYDAHASAVLTHCPRPSLGRHFDLVHVVEDALDAVAAALNETLSLSDLDWPGGITSAFVYVKSVSTALAFFFLVGILSLIVATLAAVFGLFRPSKTVTMIFFVTSMVMPLFLVSGGFAWLTNPKLSFVTITVTAGIATAIILTVVDGINSNGSEIGASAQEGNTFLALVWTSVAILFIAVLTITAQVCTGSGRGRDRPLPPSLSSSLSRRIARRARQQQRQENDLYDSYVMPSRYSHRLSAPLIMPSRPMSPYYMHPPPHPASYGHHYWDDPYSSQRTLVPHHSYDYYPEDDFS
jgi:hypothetical protein